MSVPTDLDRRFRDAASRGGLLDAGYDVVDSAARAAARRRRPTAASSASPSTPSPSGELETLARLAGPRVLRAPRAVDQARRELDEYFEGRRTAFDLDARPARA